MKDLLEVKIPWTKLFMRGKSQLPDCNTIAYCKNNDTKVIKFAVCRKLQERPRRIQESITKHVSSGS